MIIRRPKLLSIYITKEIFKYFFIIFFTLFLLFFSIDFFEITSDIKDIDNGIIIAMKVVLYRIPNMLETILHFIILLSGIFSFYKFSNNSEIVVMRSSGRSIYHIVKFPVFVSFLFGIFVITIYNPISSTLNVKSERLRKAYIKQVSQDLLEPENGLWFKQENIDEEKGEIIIRASRVYKDILVFNDVMLLYTQNGKFEKRVNTNILKLNDNNTWTATDNFIIQEGKKNEFIKQIIIPTHLTKKFINHTIENDYDSIYNIPFWRLKSLIKELELSGFDNLKFKIRFYYLITIPFLFAIMIFISAYYGIVNTRDGNKYLSIVKGILVGFIIFFSHNIITEFSNARRLTAFDGSIFIILFYILISIILLIKKDLLSNFNIKLFDINKLINSYNKVFKKDEIDEEYFK